MVGERSLAALGLADGTTRWRFEADGPLSWPTAAGDDAVYASDERGTLYARSTSDGTERWTFSTGNDGVVTNRTIEGGIVADDWNGTLYGLDPRDGDLLWAFEYGSQTAWFPQVVGERAYLGTQTGTVFALDSPPETALNRFRQETAKTDATTVGGAFVVGGTLGGLLALASRRFDVADADQSPT